MKRELLQELQKLGARGGRKAARRMTATQRRARARKGGLAKAAKAKKGGGHGEK